MMNLNPMRIIQTNNVVWLVKSFNDWCRNKALSNDNGGDDNIGDFMEDDVILI
jgi:hypothetical protein